MNLLFDQNISQRILIHLSPQFAGCQHVRLIGLEDASDMEIFRFARDHDMAVVTFDSDFIDLHAIHGMPPKIIYLNTGNLSTKNVALLLVDNALRITHYLHSDNDDILEIMK